MIFCSTRLVLLKIKFMTTEQESGTSWRDDLAALIRRKQEENELLRKVQKSFQPEAEGGDIIPTPDTGIDDVELNSDADEFAFHSDEDQSIKNENNQQ